MGSDSMDAVVKRRAKDGAGGKTRLSSVATAIRLLKAFSGDEAEIGVSALSQRLGIAKSTVHRLAVTLVSEGLLEQNPENEKYRLGVGLFGLGALVRQRMNLSSEARPFLFSLREQTNETVLLAILSQTEIMYIYNLESRQAIRMRSDVGVRQPAYCTALGRAIMAYQPATVVDDILDQPLLQRTPKTVTEPARLRKILEQVQRQGYAIDDEESEAGMRCVAAPVRDASGRVVGALGVAGPVQRLSLKALSALVGPLSETAEAISVRLGYHPRSSL
jgi:IclR family KDG regulon transcriptional repressor